MFEDSLVESRGQLGSKSRRWITAGSVGLQCLVAAVIVLVPMMRPEALQIGTMAPVVMTPLLKKAPAVVRTRSEVVSRVAASVSLPTVMAATRVAVLPSMRPVESETGGSAAIPSNLAGMGTPNGGDVLGSFGSVEQPKVVVTATKKPAVVRVSAGISLGMLLGEIRPVYPRIAVAARVEGVVIVEAMISKTGAIESARIVSGPPMLAGAAIDAVRAARYRPYLLNGEATEVATTVTVNFRLGGG